MNSFRNNPVRGVVPTNHCLRGQTRMCLCHCSQDKSCFRDKAQADVSSADGILTVKRLQYNPETKVETIKPAWDARKQSWHWKRQNLHCSDFRDSFKELSWDRAALQVFNKRWLERNITDCPEFMQGWLQMKKKPALEANSQIKVKWL